MFAVFFSQLWETTKVHTSSAICLKRDCDVLFDQEEIIVSAADNCNRLQVSLRANEAVYHTYIRPSYRRLCVRARARVCVLGAQRQDWICALPVRGEVLQDPVHMFVPEPLCCGHRAGRWYRTGRDPNPAHCFPV